MTKKAYKELIKKYFAGCVDEAYDAQQFVAELLDNMANELEKSEPYAIRTIQRYREVASEIANFETSEE